MHQPDPSGKAHIPYTSRSLRISEVDQGLCDHEPKPSFQDACNKTHTPAFSLCLFLRVTYFSISLDENGEEYKQWASLRVIVVGLPLTCSVNNLIFAICGLLACGIELKKSST